MLYTIEETYAYDVEASSAEEARQLFDDYRENSYSMENTDQVIFTQNYTNIYDTEGKEL